MTPTLHLFCGKIASGKSTLAARIARDGAILITEDDWLHALFADQMQTGADYLRCSGQLRAIMGPHVGTLLAAGQSVALDFAANTRPQRAWMRSIIQDSDAAHQLHVFDVPDAVCLARLHARNASGSHAFAVTDAQFDHFSRHFAPPAPGEGFTVITHGLGG
ncbi:MAG: cell division protein ZipA [Rhodobacteraceae bacterium]|nr:cell division protein ZipA [Paracoccaceae bacterium]